MDALKWPALVAQIRARLSDLESTVNRHGAQPQRDKAAELAEEAEEIITERKVDRLRKKLSQVRRLYFEIVFAQPGFWVPQFGLLEKEKATASDAGMSL